MGILQVLVLTVGAVLPVVLANIIVQPGYEQGNPSYTPYSISQQYQQTTPATNYRQAIYHPNYQYQPFNFYGLNDGSGTKSHYISYPTASLPRLVPLHLPTKSLQYMRLGSAALIHTSPFMRHPVSAFAVQSRARRSTENRLDAKFADDVPTIPPVNDSPVRLVVDPEGQKPGSTEDDGDEKSLTVRQSKHDDAIVGSPFLGLNPRNMYAGSHAYMHGMHGPRAEQPIMLKVIHPEARTSSADQPEDYQAQTAEGSPTNQQAESDDDPSNCEDGGQGGSIAQIDPEGTLRQMIQKIEQGRQQLANHETNMNEAYDKENDEMFKSMANQQTPTTVLQQMVQQMGRVGTQRMMPENMMNQMAGTYSDPNCNTYPETLQNFEYSPYYRNGLSQEPIIAMAPPSYSPVEQKADMSWHNQDSMQDSMVSMAQSDQAPRTADAMDTVRSADNSGYWQDEPMLKNFPDPRPIVSSGESDHETSHQDAKENPDSQKTDAHEKTDESSSQTGQTDAAPIVGTFRTHHKYDHQIPNIQPIYIPYPAPPSNPNPPPSNPTPPPTYAYPPPSYIPAPPSYVYPAPPSYAYPTPTYVYPTASYTYPYVVRRYLVYPNNYYAYNYPTGARHSNTYVSSHHMHHVKHRPPYRPHRPHIHHKPSIYYRTAGLSDDSSAEDDTGYPTYFEGN